MSTFQQQELPPQHPPCFASLVVRDASPTRQFGAVRIATGKRDLAIDKDQRQRFLTGTLQKAFHGRIFGEGHRLLRQVEALDLRAVLLRPIHIRREGDQGLIGLDAANARAATEGGVEYLNGVHVCPFAIVGIG